MQAVEHIVTTEQKPWQVRREKTGKVETANLQTNGTRHQTVKGFGGTFNELGHASLMSLGESDRKTLMDALFGDDGCRFEFCRLPIGASDYALQWYSLNEHDGDLAMEHFSIARDQQHLIPYVKQALAVRPDISFFASPWSPPTWMKTHRVCNYGTLRWEPQILKAYALYFHKFVEAYRAAGINVTQIHVQNEPIADQKFPSCVWTGDQLRQFIGEYLGPHFEKHRVPAEIWLGTINGPDGGAWSWSRYDQFANNVLSDPKASKYTRGVAYQWAGKFAVQQTALAYPDVPIIQSENECGDGGNSWRYALYVWELMQHYFTNSVVAYIYWNMILAEGGISTWGWRQNSMITIDEKAGKFSYRHEYYVMKHLARYVSPGAVRLGLRGQWTSNALCFENPDGSVVLAMVNPFPDPRPLRLKLPRVELDLTLEPSSLHTLVVPAA